MQKVNEIEHKILSTAHAYLNWFALPLQSLSQIDSKGLNHKTFYSGNFYTTFYYNTTR